MSNQISRRGLMEQLEASQLHVQIWCCIRLQYLSSHRTTTCADSTGTSTCPHPTRPARSTLTATVPLVLSGRPKSSTCATTRLECLPQSTALCSTSITGKRYAKDFRSLYVRKVRASCVWVCVECICIVLNGSSRLNVRKAVVRMHSFETALVRNELCKLY